MLCPSVCPLLSQAYIRLHLFTAAFPTSPRGWLSSAHFMDENPEVWWLAQGHTARWNLGGKI